MLLSINFVFFILILVVQPRMAVRYGTFGICVLRTSHLEPYRTSVPYFSSIFEAYRTNVPYPYHYKQAYRTYVPYPYHYKKSVPYQRTVPLSKNRGVPYRTNVPYRTVLPSLGTTASFLRFDSTAAFFLVPVLLFGLFCVRKNTEYQSYLHNFVKKKSSSEIGCAECIRILHAK